MKHCNCSTTYRSHLTATMRFATKLALVCLVAG
jgi:hypothetical protein